MSPKILIVGAALLGLGGCVAAPYSPDTGYAQGYPDRYYYQQPAPGYACGSGTAVGALGGAAAGGLIGSQFGHGSGHTAATIGGVAGGALLGGSIGNNYDRSAGC
jgi:Glycine zipper 2TM domain